MSYTILVFMSFFGALLTGLVGMGGGMIIIAIMPGLIPTGAIIPLHGLIQFASNISRVVIDIRAMNWRITGHWFIGTCLGAAMAAPLVKKVHIDYLPVLLGLLILLYTWVPAQKFRFRLPGQYFSLGLITAFLSLFVGATGPLGLTTLIREKMNMDTLIATSSALNACVQGAKVGAFLAIGFSFTPYIWLMAATIIAVIAGSLTGKMMRSKFPEGKILGAVKILLSVLAVRMIANTMI